MYSYFIVTSTLLLVVLRKRLYLITLVSVLAPVFISVALFMFPSPSSLEQLVLRSDLPILVVSRSSVSSECYEARLVNATIIAPSGNTILLALAVHTDPHILLSKLGFKLYNYTSVVLLPREIYVNLSKPREITLLLDHERFNYSVLGYWDSNIALLVDSNFSLEGNLYLCVEYRSVFAKDILESTERNLLSVAELWIYLLILVYLPVFYTAQRILVESLKVEVKSLFESGVNIRTIILSLTSTVIVLHAITVLYTCTLSIVLVYIGWSLLSYFTPLLPPHIRPGILQLVLVEVLVSFFTAYPATRGVVRQCLV